MTSKVLNAFRKLKKGSVRPSLIIIESAAAKISAAAKKVRTQREDGFVSAAFANNLSAVLRCKQVKRIKMAPPQSYHSTLLKLIGYLDGVEHPKGTEIPMDRLQRLTPTDLMRWFNKTTFDTETPSDDAKPTVRSASLEFKKKALSYFMPNWLMICNEISNVGNPTRCTELNNLIKRVKKQA